MNSQCFYELNESADGEPPAKQTRAEEPNQRPPDNGDSSASENEDDNDEEDDEQAEEALWSIDDDTLFYPRGLINHNSGGGGVRSVFVVWSDDYLLNFMFKKSSRTQRTKITRVRLSLSVADAAAGDDVEQILDVLILECNTLLLMHSGRVYYLSSVREACPVPWLNGVRCIAAARSGFSVIRTTDDGALCLETYRDAVQLGKCAATLLHRFDITYDEQNLFNCAWRDERFTLLSQLVRAEDVNYLELVCGLDFALNDVEELHFFTVSGSVFVLIPAKAATDSSSSSDPNNSANISPTFQIQLLSTYASNIQFIKILMSHRLCLIFLECGSIDVWFHSHIARALRRKTHHTGNGGFAHHTFDAANGRFYYTDVEQVAQLQFKYDPDTDSVHIQQMHKPIPGMLVLTWVEHVEQLIALSWNNIFYRLKFEPFEEEDEPNNPIEFENSVPLFELTPRKLTQLRAKAQVAEELLKLPRQLHSEIEYQFQKQQLISMSTKEHLYSSLFDASVEFSPQVPAAHLLPEKTVLLYPQADCVLQCNSLFGLIYLKITKNAIFQEALWNLHIFDINSGKMHILNIPEALLHHNLCIVLPTVWRRQSLLPVYHLKLLTFVAFEKNFLAIRMPMVLKVTARTFSDLFSAITSNFSQSSELSVDYLRGQRDETAELPTQKTPQTITHILKLNRDCTFSNILAIFRTNPPTVLVGDVDTNILALNFMNAKLQLTFIKATAEHNEATILKLTSTDAAVLYYANLHILSNLKPLLRVQQPEILMYQCEIERCYGTLTAGNVSEPASTCLHLENLKRIYHKMRNEFGLLP